MVEEEVILVKYLVELNQPKKQLVLIVKKQRPMLLASFTTVSNKTFDKRLLTVKQVKISQGKCGGMPSAKVNHSQKTSNVPNPKLKKKSNWWKEEDVA